MNKLREFINEGRILHGLTNLNESKVNESTFKKLSKDDIIEYFTEVQSGKNLHSLFKGKFNESVFRRYLGDIIRKTKNAEPIIKIWSAYFGMNPMDYLGKDFIEDVDFLNDAVKAAEIAYKEFLKVNESEQYNEYGQVNEGLENEISDLTGVRVDAINKYIEKYNLDIKALHNKLKKGKLADRMNFMRAVLSNLSSGAEGKYAQEYADLYVRFNTFNESKVLNNTSRMISETFEALEGIEMNEEELSELQKDYRKYFEEVLKGFDVDSPSKLDADKKVEFFNKIKSGWEVGKGRK